MGSVRPYTLRLRAARCAGGCLDDASFAQAVGGFVAAYPTKGMDENIRLVAHHFLDALAFWSLEDLVLSTTTILEIIAITAKRVAGAQGQTINDFTHRLAFAACRLNLPNLPPDFRKMRNDLVHEGTLSGQKFSNKDASACGVAVAEALDWIDEYVFAAMGLGKPAQPRFIPKAFQGANSFSLWGSRFGERRQIWPQGPQASTRERFGLGRIQTDRFQFQD